MVCSKIAPVSLKHHLFPQPSWRVIAIVLCSQVAPVSLKHPLFLLLHWLIFAITTCSTIVLPSLKYPLYQLLHWLIIAIVLCSQVVIRLKSRPLRLENTRLYIESRSLGQVQLQQTLLTECSPPPAAPSLERLRSTPRIISVILIRLYKGRNM